MANKSNKQRVNRYRFGRRTGKHSRKWKNRQRELLLAKKGKVSATLSVYQENISVNGQVFVMLSLPSGPSIQKTLRKHSTCNIFFS